MEEEPTNCCKKVKRKIREQDMFGVEVSLNLSKESQHNTCIGGLCSIVLLLLCGTIFGHQMYILFFTKTYS